MVTLARRAARMPFAPVVAILFGIVAAILVAAVPGWLFEQGVVSSGLPNFVAAAQPPLGTMARLLAIASAFLAITIILWAVLGPLASALEARVRARTPWRDAGYDVYGAGADDPFLAPRRPIFAPDELGAPLMSDEVMIVSPDLPPFVDADTRVLAAPAVADLAPEPLVSSALDNSIAALIRRLEEGLARRSASNPDPDPDPNAPGAGPDADRDMTDVQTAADTPFADDDSLRAALGTLTRTARG